MYVLGESRRLFTVSSQHCLYAVTLVRSWSGSRFRQTGLREQLKLARYTKDLRRPSKEAYGPGLGTKKRPKDRARRSAVLDALKRKKYFGTKTRAHNYFRELLQRSSLWGPIATGQSYSEILHMAKQYRYRKGRSLATCTWSSSVRVE